MTKNWRNRRLATYLAPLVAIAIGLEAWPWLARSVAAAAPVGHFLVKDGTVEDSATKLVWQKESSESYTWADAVKFCKALDLDGSGWRLPSVKELLTLVDETRVMPAIDASAFPDVGSDYYWTSSQVANFRSNAWAVSFAYGIDNFFDVETRERVRCVR